MDVVTEMCRITSPHHNTTNSAEQTTDGSGVGVIANITGVLGVSSGNEVSRTVYTERTALPVSDNLTRSSV